MVDKGKCYCHIGTMNLASLLKGRPTALNLFGIHTERLTAICGTDVNVRGSRRRLEMHTLAIATVQNGSHMVD
jgi:hypothetical protein